MEGQVAFVFGGGGVLGAHEVGMLSALANAGIAPDILVGTSVGAINGAMLAAHGAGRDTVARLEELWTTAATRDVFVRSPLARVGTLVRSRMHLHSPEPLRRLLHDRLPVTRFEELRIPFQCVATSIERAGGRWFSEGPLVEAVLASAAVPGLFPPVRIGDEHFLDGGLVHSIPVGRAIDLGARTVYVLQVGRVEQPLTPPSNLLQVGLVAFEIARRHRFVEEMTRVPDDVTVHVLPTGEPPRPVRLGQLLRYRDFSEVTARIDRAFLASTRYLQRAGPPDGS